MCTPDEQFKIFFSVKSEDREFNIKVPISLSPHLASVLNFEDGHSSSTDFIADLEEYCANLQSKDDALAEKEQELAEREQELDEREELISQQERELADGFSDSEEVLFVPPEDSGPSILDTLESIQEELGQIEAVSRAVHALEPELNTLKELYTTDSEEGLMALCALSRTLRQENLSCAQILEDILRERFYCIRFSPLPGTPFDSQSMEPLSPHSTESVVDTVKAVGWRRNDVTLLKARVTLKDKA